MNINIHIKELLRQYLAPHRRQSGRLAWLGALTEPLSLWWDEFAAWRTYYRYKIHITSQHKSLAGHLKKLFGAEVVVHTRSNMYLAVGLNEEKAAWVSFEPCVPIALEGDEELIFADADFLIYAPAGTDLGLLVAEVEKLLLADKTYKIIVR